MHACVHVCVFRIADEIEIVRGELQRVEKTGKTEVPLGAGENWASCWLDRTKGWRGEKREERSFVGHRLRCWRWPLPSFPSLLK